MPFREAGLLEVPAHLGAIGAGEAEQVLYISQVLHEPGGVVDHGLDLHRREVLGAGDGGLAPAELEAAGAGRKQQARRLLVHVDEVHPAPVGVRVLVVRVAGGGVQRLVAELPQQRPDRLLRGLGRQQVEVEGGPALPVGVERQGARERVWVAELVEPPRQPVEDPDEIQGSPPGRENSTRGYAPRMASTGLRREARSAG